MCLFITLLVPKSADVERLREIGRPHEIGLALLAMSRVAGPVQADEVWFLTALGHCDCDTDLGSAVRGDDPYREGHREDGRKFKALRDRGWSESRIVRWREQQEAVRRRNQRIVDDRARDGIRRRKVADWFQFISDALGIGSASHLALLIHHYSGSIEDEAIQIKERRTVPLASLNEEVLLQLRQDVLYDFVSRASATSGVR